MSTRAASDSRALAVLRRRVDAFLPEGANSPAFAGLLKTKLYPYQREGALFAARAGR